RKSLRARCRVHAVKGAIERKTYRSVPPNRVAQNLAENESSSAIRVSQCTAKRYRSRRVIEPVAQHDHRGTARVSAKSAQVVCTSQFPSHGSGPRDLQCRWLARTCCSLGGDGEVDVQNGKTVLGAPVPILA